MTSRTIISAPKAPKAVGPYAQAARETVQMARLFRDVTVKIPVICGKWHKWGPRDQPR